ncbi:MAG: response regulator [Archangiaceae bacterium]|nr:response regulator [Archangiaceae bacterium]
MASLSSAVLVVDDEPSVLQLLEVLLKRQSLQVQTAVNGSDAIRLMLDNSYGCLMVDKNLPDKSGLDVIAEARRLHPYCACIVMTAFPSYDSILAAMRMGAVDYLEKPFHDLPLVAQKVARAVEQQQIVFERDTFAKLLREMRGELKKRDLLLKRQQSDLEVLQELIDDKVKERTSKLEAQLKQLEEELRAVKTPLAT